MTLVPAKVTLPNVTDFQKKNFSVRLSSKFATKACLNIPPRLEHVATTDVNSWEIAFPGRESQFPGIDLLIETLDFTRVCTFYGMMRVGSLVEERMGSRTPFLVDAGIDRHSQRWRGAPETSQNGRGRGLEW